MKGLPLLPNSMVSLLLLTGSSSSLLAQKPSKLAPPSVETIAQTWQARQQRIRSASFAWKETYTEMKGSWSDTMPRLLIERNKLQGKILPPQDVTTKLTSTLLLDGIKVRYEYDGDRWSFDVPAPRREQYISLFDGKLCKSCRPLGSGSWNWPGGLIRASAMYCDAGKFDLRPILMTTRPMTPELRVFDIREMKIVSTQARMQDRPCIELLLTPASNSYFNRIWVDPARDSIILRQVTGNRGVIESQIDIRYRQDERGEWLPEGWEILSLVNPSQIESQTRAEVTQAEYNLPIDPAQFDLRFPVKTRVSDERTRTSFLVREDGSHRPILRSEWGIKTADLYATEPGELTGEQSSAWRRWSTYVLIGLACLSLVLFTWRRLRRNITS